MTPTRGTSWGGPRHKQARAHWQDRLPLPCARCGETVWPHDTWHIGHRIPRSLAPELQWDLDNQWPEHATCNTSAGARPATTPPPVHRRPW